VNRVTPFTNAAVDQLAHAKHELVHVQITVIAVLVILLLEEEVFRILRPRDAVVVRTIRIAAGVLVVAFAAVIVSRAFALR
jgi:hypothetical protein